MIVPSQAVKVLIATKPVDFRKGHDGLAAYVEKELGLKAHSGVVVVFRAKRADRIKILVWDGSGLVLTYKRLEGGKFALLSPIASQSSAGQGARHQRRRDAALESAIRSVVRRSGLAPCLWAKGAGTGCGGVNQSPICDAQDGASAV